MNMRIGSIAIGTTMILLATLALFVIPQSYNLYVAYTCCIISIILQTVLMCFTSISNIPVNFVLLCSNAWILPGSLVLSTVVLLLERTDILTVNTVLHIILQFVLFVLFGIRFMALITEKHHIEKLDKRASYGRNRIFNLVNIMASMEYDIGCLPEKTRSDAEKAWRLTIESLKYADPISNSSVEKLDNNIEYMVNNLKAYCNTQQIGIFIEQCKYINAAVKERNAALLNSKS